MRSIWGMKKTVSTLLLLFLVIVWIPSKNVIAYETLDKFTYSLINGEAKITKYSGSVSNLVIPSEIYHNGSFIKVKGIEFGAFSYNNNLKTLEISEGIETVSAGAIVECINLTTVKLPASLNYFVTESIRSCSNFESYVINPDSPRFKIIDNILYELDNSGMILISSPPKNSLEKLNILESVTQISDYSLADNVNLKQVVFHNGAMIVDSYAFSGCTALTKILIPANTEIKQNTFIGCSSLEYFEVAPGNPYHQSIQGVLFNQDASILMKFPASSSIESFVIPEQTIGIDPNSFEDLRYLTEVTMPQGVVNITYSSFENAVSLQKVNLSSNTHTIGAFAFENCALLTTINMPESLQTISGAAFNNCDSLVNLELPKNVQTIGPSAFRDNNSLKQVILPDSLTSLGQSAFEDCNVLESVTFGTGLKNIPLFAFTNTSIRNLVIPGNIKVIDQSSFYKSQIENIVLEEGIEFIGTNAFANNNITHLKFPQSLKALGDLTFFENQKLESVELSTLLTEIPFRTFGGCSNLKDINLHEGLTKFGWGAFEGANIEVVHLPKTVTDVGDFAFSSNSLKKVYFYGNAPIIRSRSFNWINTLYYKSGTSGWDNINGYSTKPFYLMTYSSQHREDLLPLETPYLSGESGLIWRYPEAANDENHYFSGWRVLGMENETQYPANSTHTFSDRHLELEAIWSQEPLITVSFNTSDATAIPDQYVRLLEKAEVPVIQEREGYIFDGWYRDGLYQDKFDFEEPLSASTELFGKWEVKKYTVEFDSDGGSFVSNIVVEHGAQISKPDIIVKEGHTLVEWDIAPEFTTSWDFEIDQVTRDLTLKAKWNPNNYNVIFETNGGNILLNQSALYGHKLLSPDIPTKEGYTFESWFTSLSFEKEWNFEEDTVSRDQTLYAKWNPIPYEIRFETFGGTVVPTRTQNYDTLVMKPSDPVLNGNLFEGWYLEDSYQTTFDFNTMKVNENLVLYAKWNPIPYEIRFETLGGTVIPARIQNYDTLVVKPSDPVLSGYRFEGWYLEDSYQTAFDFSSMKVKENLVLYAKWNSIPYEIRFETLGGTIVPTRIQNYDTLVVKPSDPVLSGYRFEGWYLEESYQTAFDFSSMKVKENLVLFAKWNPVPFEIRFETFGGTLVPTRTQNYDTLVVKPSDPALSGYRFEGWYLEESYQTAFDFSSMKVKGNLVLYAKWNPIPYEIRFVTFGGTEIPPRTQDYDTLVVKPNDPVLQGYYLNGWYLEDNYQTYFDFNSMKVKGNLVLYAKWNANTHIVTFNSNNGDTVFNQSTQYGNKLVSPEIPIREGYIFEGWFTSLTYEQEWNFETDTVSGDLMLYAKWNPIPYEIRFETFGGTAILVRTQNYDTLIARPSDPVLSGYRFEGWYREETYQTVFDFNTMKVTGNLVLYAKWVSQSLYDVVAGANRYYTAAEISKKTYEEADTVILASGENYPDALAGGPLAYLLNAPILLTQQNRIPKGTMDEIIRLGASKVIILGSDLAVSEGVAKILTDMGIQVERVAGSSRYITAVEVAKRVQAASVIKHKAVIASGMDFADALSAGSYASMEGIPILLTRSDRLMSSLSEALQDLGITEVVLIGGSSAVNPSVEDAIRALGIQVTRYSGDNRYLTSIVIAQNFYQDSTEAIIANGMNFPDALAAVPMAAKMKAPIILAGNGRISASVLSYIGASNLTHVRFVGGEAMVPLLVRTQVAEALQ